MRLVKFADSVDTGREASHEPFFVLFLLDVPRVDRKTDKGRRTKSEDQLQISLNTPAIYFYNHPGGSGGYRGLWSCKTKVTSDSRIGEWQGRKMSC